MKDITYLYHTDVSELIDAINKISDERWYEFTLRQQLFEPHKDTLTIPFKWSLVSEYRNYNQSRLFDTEYNYNNFPPELIDAIGKISKELKNYWGKYDISNVLLLKLLAGKSIATHVDGGNLLETAKRCHMALITDPNVSFTVGSTTMHMGVGDWYLINNMVAHSVDNNSLIDRVHLVIDVGNTQ